MVVIYMESFEKGNILYHKRNYIEALEKYKEALLTNENNSTILYNIGVCFLKLERYFDSIEFFKKAISNSYNSKYFYNIGYCYTKLNNHKKALVYFNTSWAIDNSDDDCKNAINLILKKYKK